MLRITRIAGTDSVTLKLEGTLLAAWVDEVLAMCHPALLQATRTRLDLTHTTFVDHAGTSLLRELLRQGVEIAACSSFVAELLELEKP